MPDKVTDLCLDRGIDQVFTLLLDIRAGSDYRENGIDSVERGGERSRVFEIADNDFCTRRSPPRSTESMPFSR